MVALVAGLLWGARQGVQFSLTMVVLKAMPVLIIGGFSSIPGAIVGGLLVGASESLADIYIGPLVNGSRLQLVRLHSGGRLPAGPAVRTVRRSAGREGLTDVRHLASPVARCRSTPINPRAACAVLGAALPSSAAVPLVGDEYWLNSHPDSDNRDGSGGPRAQSADGLRGAGVAGHRGVHVDRRLLGLQPVVARAAGCRCRWRLIVAGLIAACFGVLFGLPSLRIKGFYLARRRLGAQFFFEWLFTNFHWFSNDSLTLTISAPRLEFLGHDLSSPAGRYLLVLVTTASLYWLAHNIVDSRIGRDWMAIRDMDTAAAVIGIPVGAPQAAGLSAR